MTEAKFSGLNKELTKAMVQFQLDVEPPVKASQGYNYKYADFAQVRAAVVPALSKNNMVITQPIRLREIDGKLVNTVYTRLSHVSGEYVDSEMIPAQQSVNGKTNPHHITGAGITYTKRMAYLSILGLAPEDDDAEIASPKKEYDNRSARTKTKELIASYKQLASEAVELGVPASDIPTLPKDASGGAVMVLGKKLRALMEEV